MANGVMPGTGTREAPFIVEDGWDLDSIRNLPAAVWHWVELANDINLGIFPNWTPLPARQINLNGKGYTIKNLRITSSSSFTRVGLFDQLETLETKDLRIEAEITHTNGSNSDTGILCGRLIPGPFGPPSADPPRVSNISNIQCYGNINMTVTGSVQPTGGCFGSTWGESNATLNISDCAYYGNISCHITTSSTTSPSSTQLRSFGGILGFADARGSISNYSITLANCISVTQFIAVGGAAHGIFGGIMGAARAGQAPAITGCVAKNRLLVTNTQAWAQTIWFGGIFGAGIVACNIANCAAHNEVLYNPVGSVASLHIAGLHCMRSTGTSPVNTSYAVIDFRNPNGAELPATNSMRGIGGQTVITNSFFDADVLAIGWSGAVTTPEWGRTTAQLQSKEFLELQGWVFADV